MFILNKQMIDKTNKSFSEFSASRLTLRRQQWTEELKTFSPERVIKASTNCKGSGWNIRIHPQSQGWLGYKDHSRPCNALKIPVTVLPHTCPWCPSLERKAPLGIRVKSSFVYYRAIGGEGGANWAFPPNSKTHSTDTTFLPYCRFFKVA